MRCEITDDVFVIIANSILKRATPFEHINLDSNYLTIKSVDILKELISKNKCQYLMIFGNDGISNNKEIMKELKKLAATSNVRIFSDNPSKRSYPSFLDKAREDFLKTIAPGDSNIEEHLSFINK